MKSGGKLSQTGTLCIAGSRTRENLPDGTLAPVIPCRARLAIMSRQYALRGTGLLMPNCGAPCGPIGLPVPPKLYRASQIIAQDA